MGLTDEPYYGKAWLDLSRETTNQNIGNKDINVIH